MPLVRANGINLHYDLRGPDDAPVIAFGHSIGATLEMWDAQVEAFAGRYRCLRWDARWCRRRRRSTILRTISPACSTPSASEQPTSPVSRLAA